MSVLRILEGKEVCVCAGPGGVGKTTCSAAIALGMAAEGKRVAVVTIDPARRLARALGLPEPGGEARRVEPERFEAAGLDLRGELWAMVLDPKRTFDELVERYAPDARTRDELFSNRIYQQLSSAVAGSQEYMAMEKLLELHEEGRYELLLLDTPPARSALEFLDAPGRLSRFIDSSSRQFFTSPGKGLGLAGRGGGLLFAALKRITGVDVLQDLSEFFQTIAGMADGLSERAGRVTELLREERSTFLIVSSPQRDSADEAIFFRRRLRERGMPLGGAIVNRVGAVEPASRAGRHGEGVEEELVGLLGPSLARRVARNLADYRALAERDRQSIALLARELAPAPLVPVPHLDEDVGDAAGLARMSEHLFAPNAVPAQAIRRPGKARV